MTINKWYSLLFLFLIEQATIIRAENVALQPPASFNFQADDFMQDRRAEMSSAGTNSSSFFKDLQKATPQDLKMQAQMGQEMIANMSQEELAEINAIMEDMLKNMTPEELDELMKMAEVIDQQLTPEERKALEEQFMPPAPVEKVQEVKTVPAQEVKAEPKKEQQVVYAQEVSAVQKLAKEITQIIKTIVQKSKTKKSLQEYLHNQWNDKEEFDIFVKDIARLQDEKVATAFVQAMSKESLIKDLFEELQTFKKEISNLNDELQVTDSFGAEDHKEMAKHKTILEKITSFCSNALRNIKVSLSKFFSLHIKEGQESAKQHDEKSKKAKDFEASNGKGRPATPNLSSSYSSGYTPYTGSNNYGYSSSSDYNPDLYNSDYYYPHGQPSADYNPYEMEYQPRSSSHKNSGSEKSNSSAPASGPMYMPQQQQTKNSSSKIPLDDVTQELDDFLQEYDKTHVTALDEISEKYPDLTTNNPESMTADQKAARINQFEKALDDSLSDSEKAAKTVEFKKKLEAGKVADSAAISSAFKNYEQQVTQKVKTPTDEISDLHKTLTKLTHKVNKLSAQDAATLKDSDQMKSVQSRLQDYETSFTKLATKHTQQSAKNRVDVSGAGSNDAELSMYDEATKKIDSTLSSFNTLFEKAKKSYSSLISKLEKQMTKKSNSKKEDHPRLKKGKANLVAQEQTEEDMPLEVA